MTRPDRPDFGLVQPLLALARDGWVLARVVGTHLLVDHVNPAALGLLGVSAQGARPDGDEVLPAYDRPALMVRLAGLPETGGRVCWSLPPRDDRGGLELVAVAMPGSPGMPGGVAMQVTSVPARGDRQVRRRDDRLRAALEGGLDGFVVLTALRGPSGEAEDFQVEAANPVALRTLGRTHEEVTGAIASVVFPAAAGTPLPGLCRQVLATGEPMSAEVEYADERARGAFEIRAMRIDQDSLTISFRDVTARRRDRRALEESERRSLAAVGRSEALRDVAAELATALTVGDVTTVMWRHTRESLAADGLLVVQLDDEHRLQLVRSEGYDAPLLRLVARVNLDDGMPLSTVVRTGESLFLSSPADYLSRFPHHGDLLAASEKRCWAALPLTAAGRVIGSWITAWSQERSMEADDRALLSTLAGLYAQALERARLFERQRDAAHVLQQALLPRALEPDPGTAVAARYRPAGLGLDVGGDFYDVIRLPDGGVAVVLGDVAGHGVRAAAVMGILRTALRSYALEGHRPAGVLERVNRLLSVYEPDELATCCYLELRPDEPAVTVVLAGHPAPALLDDVPTLLDAEVSLPLGVDPAADFTETTLLLPRGSVVVLYTDGLVETPEQSVTDGQQALLTALAQAPSREPDAIADHLLATLLQHQVYDDVALLVVHPSTGSDHRGASVSRSYPAEPASVAAARGFVVDVLCEWDLESLADTSALLVSELVTNAVLHTPEPLEVTVGFEAGVLRVEVADHSDRLPQLRDAVDEDATSGRGLLIVEVLSSAWGSEPAGTGKRVWFTLDAA